MIANLVFTALVAQSSYQATLSVRAPGMPEGRSTITHKITADGGKKVNLTVDLETVGGRIVKVRSETTYGPNAEPIRMFHETTTIKPNTRRQVTVTFDAKGAHALVDEGGKRSVKDVPLVEVAPRALVAEFWFIRDVPIVGEAVKFYYFDVVKLDWVLHETTYLGRASVSIGGKKYSGHKVEGTTGQTILDDTGLPLRIDAQNAVFERIFSPTEPKP